ncbi:MAG TPA: C40 family peptidase [Gemmatimonadales bacterium]|nr:C40 family peptidase [Gemmatimonadales bacterium]
MKPVVLRLIALLVVSTIEIGSGMPLNAQTIEARVGRFWDSEGWSTYRLGISRPLSGAIGIQLHGDVTRRHSGGAGGLTGLGSDLTVFRKIQGGPYLVAGLSGGLGSETSNSLSDPWGSWSAGVGFDVFPLDLVSVGAEARWREVSLGGRDGPELAIGVAIHLGSGAPARSAVTRSVAPPVVQSPVTLTDSIIATASDAMGRPYEFGGTGEDGGGFDCSGLIQYAYGRHGIVLPRRSIDQAREGTRIEPKLHLLKPGDLLTFSNRGRRVTHVGLYMGEGRFIHSATRGVQVSTLSAEDPYGRWWYQRWIGVRRIIP